VYSNPRVAAFVNEHFVPVRVHVKEQRQQFQQLGQRFDAQWTPTTLIIDSAGNERHRIEGFLPLDDFLSQLALGLGRAAFASGDFAAAERTFRDVLNRYPESDAAAEALYWAGVSRYKGTGDANALRETARAFADRYQNTSWAKKASVWNP
jgi:TolA-binding protein